MARKALDRTVKITCPYCKTEKLSVKVNLQDGFKTVRICPNCRFKFSMEIINGGVQASYKFLGVAVTDVIPLRGLVSAQKSKVSNGVVALYRAKEAGFFTDREYAVVCTKHDTGNFYFFDSYGDVMKWQAKTDQWCDGCKKEHSGGI